MVEEYIFGEDFEIKQKNSNLIKSDSFGTGGASIRPSKFSCQFHPVEVQFAECLLPGKGSSISSWYVFRSAPIYPYRIYTRLVDRRESKLLWNWEPTIGKHDSYRYSPLSKSSIL